MKVQTVSLVLASVGGSVREGNGESRIANRSCLALPNPPSPSPFSAWHAGYSRLSWNSRALSDSLAPSNLNIDWSLNSGSPLTFLMHSLWLSRSLGESELSSTLSLVCLEPYRLEYQKRRDWPLNPGKVDWYGVFPSKTADNPQNFKLFVYAKWNSQKRLGSGREF